MAGRGQPGLAGPDRLHDQHGPPVRVPGRRGRPARGGNPRRPPDRRPVPPDPGVDEPRAVGGRAAAGLRGRVARRVLAACAGRDRPLARPVARRDDPDRGRAVLAVLGDRGADARLRRAGPRAPVSGCTPTWPRPRTRSSSAWPSSAARPPSTSRTWAGSARTCGWRTACTCPMRRWAGSRATGTGVAHCPTLQRPAGRGHRASAQAARRGCRGRAGRGRGRVERVRPDGRRAAPGAAGGPVRGRPAGADRAGLPADGHHGRGALPGPGRRARLARAGEGGRPGGVAGGRAARGRDRGSGVARWCSARPRWSTCSSAATRW